MAESINNRYRILHKIGQGGMGAVYLVEDTLHDNQVMALKTIHADLLGEHNLAQFKYEFAALGQLRHPNLVAVYDFGTVAGSREYFFTMEYVPGEDLSTLVAERSRPVLPASDYGWLYGILVQVCRALHYIHSRGLVHYDVKPRNIRVTPDGQVKLMDFGLIGEARGQVQLKVRGTPEYIAPELIRGDPVDQRADLYSLGVSLYEVVTGRLPFADTSSMMVIRKQIEAEPEPPSRLAGDIPEKFQGLILKLMAKEPANRIASADAVIQVINDISGLNFPVETKATKRGYIQSGNLVGRDFEMARLQGLLLRAMQGQGRLALVTGTSGAGKSRLVRELRLRAQMQRVLVCGETCPDQASAPFHPWVSIAGQIIAYLRSCDLAAVEQHSAALVELMPALASQLGSGAPTLQGQRRKQELIDGVADFILGCSVPLLLIVEDLHHADAETVELLEAVGRRAGQGRVLVCGVYRDDEISPQHPLAALIGQARPISRVRDSQPAVQVAEAPYDLLRLDPLDETGVAEMVRSMLGVGDLPAGLLPRLMAETGGNPLFVESVMRSLVEEDLMQYDGQAWQIDVDGLTRIPASIEEATQRRLAHFARRPEILDLLQWAAVMGQWLDMDVLVAVCGLAHEDEHVLGLLNRAVQWNVLAIGGQGKHETYHFSNDHLRQAVYNTLAPQDRATRHGRVAETLRQFYNESDVAESLAWHLERAGDAGRALHYYGRAAAKAKQVHANESAIQFYSRALALAEAQPGLLAAAAEFNLRAGRHECYRLVGNWAGETIELKEMARLAQETGQVAHQVDVINRQIVLANTLGNLDEARRVGEEALDMIRRLGDRKMEADTMLSFVVTCFRMADYDRVQRYATQALEIYQELGDQAGQASCMLWLGHYARRRGHVAEAKTHYERSMALCRALGERKGEADALNALGILTEDYAVARQYHEQTLAIMLALGDKSGQARSYNNLALLHGHLGLYNKAREYARQAVQVAREIQSRYHLVYMLETLGRLQLELGDYAQAEQTLEEGASISRDMGTRLNESLSLITLSRVMLAQGRLDRARDLAEQAAQMHRELKMPAFLSTSLAWLGAIYLARGEWQAAERATAEAVAHLEQAGNVGDFPMRDIWWLRYQALKNAPTRAEGDPLDAEMRRCLEHAREAMLDSIASLSDEGLRRNYLNKIQINRDIIAEWAQYGTGEKKPAAEAAPPPAEPVEIDRSRDKLKRVLDISVQMNETHDIASLLNYVMDQVIELSGAERGFLVLVDETGRMDFKVTLGMAQDEIERARAQVSYTVLGAVAQSRAPILLQDALTDERFAQQASVLGLNLRSVLCVPLVSRSELVGMIYADNRTVTGRFSQADVDLMVIFASQAATAIENARLYQETARANQELETWARTLEQRVAERTAELEQANATLSRRAVQLEASRKVAGQITTLLQIDELLDQVVRLIHDYFGYYFVGVWLVQPELNRLALRAWSGREGLGLEGREVSISRYDCMPVAQACQDATYHLVQEAEGCNFILAGTRSELALPLQMGHLSVAGVLDIQSDQPAAFAGDDVMVLQGLAGQIAIAIRNAWLYDEVRRFSEQLEHKVQERTEELKQAYQTLERLDRTKTDFINVAAHELRTPLTLIMGYGTILEHKVASDAEARTLVQGILTGEDRLLQVVNRLLDVAKIDSRTLQLRPKPLQLKTVLQHVGNEFKLPLDERRLTLETAGLDSLPVIEADGELLSKVFYHLVINAIKYTPDGGSIQISGQAFSSENAVEVVVADTGIGIDPAHHELIFEKFYQTGQVALHSSGQTKFKGGGPGLGLAIARGIVQAHGGRIWVESPGCDEERCPGSRFHVLLPVKH